MHPHLRLALFSIFLVVATSLTTATLMKPVQPGASIETDQKTGVVRLILNGQEEARVDSAGLHIRGNIFTGGSVVNAGEQAYGK